MTPLILLILRLAVISFVVIKGIHGVKIQNVKLLGGNNNYINIRSKASYVLSCPYTAPFDDPVRTVRWFKDSQMIYFWNEGETSSTALMELSGKVATSTKQNLQNLHFNKKITLNLSGSYTCEVESRKGKTKSEPFHLVVLDIPSDEYFSDVTLLSDSPEEKEEETEDENANCTLIWNFRTPAISPRPNVTCGYYSYLHDDVTNSVPAGLTMQLLTNGSWQAGFDHIHIQVAEIPREQRLGCSVEVPETNYKKVIKFEDNFAIDHLIDSEGCPAMFLDPEYKLEISYGDNGERNCRGDIVPISTNEPLSVQLSCSPGHVAMFTNGSVFYHWSVELTCNPVDMTWHMRGQDDMGNKALNLSDDIPTCLRNGNGGGSRVAFPVTWIFRILIFSSLIQFLT